MKLLNATSLATACVTVLIACGRSTDAPASAGVTSATEADAATNTPAKSSLTACEMVSAEQMSTILGAVVAAEPVSDSYGKTDCSYEPKDGSITTARLSIEYGSAEAAMAANVMLGRIEPGMTNSYEGLGDQAAVVGPEVWIRRGEDLITIMVFGVDEPEAAVKRIYDLVTQANK